MPVKDPVFQTLEDRLEPKKLKDIVDKVIADNIMLVAEYFGSDKKKALSGLIGAVVKASKGHTSPMDARKALLNTFRVLSK